ACAPSTRLARRCEVEEVLHGRGACRRVDRGLGAGAPPRGPTGRPRRSLRAGRLDGLLRRGRRRPRQQARRRAHLALRQVTRAELALGEVRGGGLGGALREAAYLEGDFVLRSGRRSRYYLDKYRFETRPDLLRELGAAIAETVREHEPDAVRLAGPELGAVAL